MFTYRSSKLEVIVCAVVTILQVMVLSVTNGPLSLRKQSRVAVTFKSMGKSESYGCSPSTAWSDVVSFLRDGAHLGFHEVMEVSTVNIYGEQRLRLTAIRVKNGLRRLIVRREKTGLKPLTA